jgi:hypothetical protein
VLGPGHPDTLAVKVNLGNTLNRAGRLREAEQVYRETLEAQQKAMSWDNPDTLVTISQLASNLRSQGRFAEVEQLMREALNTRKRVLGPDHPQTIQAMQVLASVLSRSMTRLYHFSVHSSKKLKGQPRPLKPGITSRGSPHWRGTAARHCGTCARPLIRGSRT